MRKYKDDNSAALQNYLRCKSTLRETIRVGQYNGYKELEKGCLVQTPDPMQDEQALGTAQSLGIIGVSASGGGGVTVTRLTKRGPAELAGLAVGDVITEIDGKPIKPVPEESELMSTQPIGSVLLITYVRGSDKRKAEWEAAVVLGNGDEGRSLELDALIL